MQQQTKKTVNLLAMLISLAIHAVVLGILYFVYMQTTEVPPTDNLQYTMVSGVISGAHKSKEQTPEGAEQSKVPVSPKVKVKENKTPTPIHQTKEKISPDRKIKTITSKVITQTSSSEIKAQEDNRAKQRAKEQKQISNSVAGAFGKAQSQQGLLKQGTTTTAKGSGYGSDSYSLAGRSIIGNGGYPARPNSTKAIRGRVVVGILVNAQGVVIDAWIDPKGTQIADPNVRKSAINAAKRTAFNVIAGTNNQRGKIIYNFDIQ